MRSNRIYGAMLEEFPGISYLAIWDIAAMKKTVIETSELDFDKNHMAELVRHHVDQDVEGESVFHFDNEGFLILYPLNNAHLLIVGSNLESSSIFMAYLAQVKMKLLMEDVEVQDKLENGQHTSTKLMTDAQRIQNSILPDIGILEHYFNDVLVYFKPKEDVGGDFYWFKEFGNKIFICVGDCTGHGVEGVMATMTVSTILRKSVNSADVDLVRLGSSIYDDLSEYEINAKAAEQYGYGMGVEMGLMVYDKASHTVSYLSIGIPLIHISNNEPHIIRSRNMFDGDSRLKKDYLKAIRLDLTVGDTIILLTDGLTDQFGGEAIKRLRNGNLLEWLEKGVFKSEKNLDKQMKVWMGKNEQTDDITLIKFKIT